MRTTINLDDDLLNEAQRVTGLQEQVALIHAGLRALIRSDDARRLACDDLTGSTSKTVRRPGSARGLLEVLVEDDSHLGDFEEYLG